ncbi:ABC transporter substrate-binding protein [Streptacidiphilus sp. P02-A3a]|uniref:ABC transporter substrate-binding protein n=1 Tax=Streptacidiphilus sp. P02-A3a TaxID=2704468 RepID=UPI0015FB9CD9|nr:ABC transporter substrate-binding protein [Streptacidiphilus sp. P02-A3a]QMU71230.1 ABC transporter substrate-binding protein [Streptacidiphilus sp. P02-A3a]
MERVSKAAVSRDAVSRSVDRRGFLRLTGALAAAAAVTQAVAACSGPASNAAGSGGSGGGAKSDTIRAGISYSLSSGFDPMSASGATPVAANNHIFEALVDLDPASRTAYPALAAAMPQAVNPTTYRVSLRKGATFHDGSAVTADDVVFSFTRVLNPASASLMAEFVPFLSGVKKIDPSTVEFDLKYPFPLFADRLATVKIVPRKLVTADPKGFDAKPVGSGPWALVSATPNDKIIFKKWDGYNGHRPAKVPNMVWYLTSDATARVNALISGQTAAIEDVPYIDVSSVQAKETLRSVQSFGNLFLMFNCSAKPYDDKRVRQALHYALDVDKIVQTAMFGNGTPSTGYLQPTHPNYHRAATVYGYDPARAKSLLAAAGVSNLSITLTTTNTDWVSDIAPMVKEAWDAIGVQTTLDIGDSSGQYAKVDSNRFTVLLAPGDPSVFGQDADLLIRWFYDGQWPTTRFRWHGTAPDVQVRALLDQAARSSDTATRTTLWNQVMDVVADQCPLYPIVHRKLPTAWNAKALSGFHPLPTTGLSFLDVDTA